MIVPFIIVTLHEVGTKNNIYVRYNRVDETTTKQNASYSWHSIMVAMVGGTCMFCINSPICFCLFNFTMQSNWVQITIIIWKSVIKRGMNLDSINNIRQTHQGIQLIFQKRLKRWNSDCTTKRNCGTIRNSSSHLNNVCTI